MFPRCFYGTKNKTPNECVLMLSLAMFRDFSFAKEIDFSLLEVFISSRIITAQVRGSLVIKAQEL